MKTKSVKEIKEIIDNLKVDQYLEYMLEMIIKMLLIYQL